MLLSDLKGLMPARNASCVAELMTHVKQQGVRDVQEVEDVLLVHIGLVSTLAQLERSGRPASAERDKQLCARLKKADIAELGSWLAAHHAAVEQRLQLLSWQSWGAAVGQKPGLASAATCLARLEACSAQAALTSPRLPPEPLASVGWPRELASGRHEERRRRTFNHQARTTRSLRQFRA